MRHDYIFRLLKIINRSVNYNLLGTLRRHTIEFFAISISVRSETEHQLLLLQVKYILLMPL